MTLRMLFIAASLAFVSVAYSGQLEDGLAAYARGDYATAVKLLQPLAEKKHIPAKQALGRIYREIIQKSGDSSSIREAIIAIAAIEGKGGAIVLLKDLFDSPHIMLETSDCIIAIGDLWDAKLDNAQAEVLMTMLDELIKLDTENNYRVQIIKTLAGFRDKRATAPLLKLAKDRDIEARLSRLHVPGNAGYALMQLGNVNAVEPLIAALKDPDRQIRLIAAVTLRRHHDKRATLPLVEALKDTDEDVRFAVIEALGNRGDSAALPALRVLLDDADETVRKRAASALEKLKTLPHHP